MTIIQIIVLIVVVGLVMWLINSFVPMAEPYKRILNTIVPVVMVVFIIVWLLRLFGIV